MATAEATWREGNERPGSPARQRQPRKEAPHADEGRLASSHAVPSHPPIAPGDVLRHFTVAVFVVFKGQVLLHYHRKLGKWLPPGGHIEDNELPDQAARREVLEETGIRVRLVGGLPVDEPVQLALPAGIQVEDIYPGHQHID